MSFTTIVLLVLAAVVALALLSVFFKALIALLPVGLVVILLLWLYYRFTGGRNTSCPAGRSPTGSSQARQIRSGRGNRRKM